MVQIVVEPPLHVVPMTEGGRAHKLTVLRVSLESVGVWRLRVNQPGVRRRHALHGGGRRSVLGVQAGVALQHRAQGRQAAVRVLCHEDAGIIDLDAVGRVLSQEALQITLSLQPDQLRVELGRETHRVPAAMAVLWEDQ